MLKFKDKKDEHLFLSLNPILIMIYADLYSYAKINHNIELVITDTISTPAEDAKLGRVSLAHQQARALDIRTKGINTWIVVDCLEYINKKDEYKKYHYLSHDGFNRLAYWHGDKDVNEHIHLAIHTKYARILSNEKPPQF